MSVASQQHDDIASELKSSFADHSYIQVKNVASGSSEEYEVTFNVRGLIINDEDEVQESQNHVIHITIPFGFPLFPPSCKPITPIFHPDFDPGAICLGDFWDQDRSCTELIEFLAKMISGETYSKENAFNEKAAAWYVSHTDQFPLVSDGELPKSSEPDDDDNDFELDTVQEDDFSTDFDYLSLDSEDDLEGQEQGVFKESLDYDLELLQERLDQKRFQQLDRELNAIPISVEFAERDFLRSETDKALTESKKLQRKGQGLEASNDLAGALAVYQQAKATVADLYGVESTIQRLQQAIALADSIGQPKDEPEEEILVEEEEVEEAPKKKLNISLPQINISRKYLLILPLIFIFWFGVKAFFANKRATTAQNYFIECKNLIGKRQFREAQYLCDKANIEGKYVDFIFYDKRMTQLSQEVRQILTSENFTKGLEGKILVDGVWVYEDETIRISPFETLTTQAAEATKSKNWNQATKMLRQASPLAKTDQEKTVVKEMSHTVDFYKAEAEALAEYDTNGCTSAEELLIKAQEKAKDIPFDIRNRHLPEISYRLTKCTFDQLIVEGNKLYETTDWNDALPVYRDALKKIESSPFPERIAIADIKNKISRAELYSSINEGNQAFAANNWNTAIEKYQQAIQFIESDPELSKDNDSRITSKKLSRIILQAKIVSTQQEVKSLINDNKFGKAIDQFQDLKTIVKDSNFSKENDFIRIVETIDTEIATLKHQAVTEKLKQYLTKNYVDLFQENYPAASEETLKDPIATYVLKKDKQMIFKLQATEIGRGRPLTLVMFYAYNKTTKQWKFTSNPDNKK